MARPSKQVGQSCNRLAERIQQSWEVLLCSEEYGKNVLLGVLMNSFAYQW